MLNTLAGDCHNAIGKLETLTLGQVFAYSIERAYPCLLKLVGRNLIKKVRLYQLNIIGVQVLHVGHAKKC